jgi:5'-3' exoribonuclease 1
LPSYGIKVEDRFKPRRINGVPRHAVLHPAHAEGRLQGQVFVLGDRVTYIQNSGKVNMATAGTVVGINISTVDVVFDVPILSGSTLGGRCPENRGSIVPKSSVLNLTNPTVVALSKAALDRKSDNLPSEDTSRASSPATHATRPQLNRIRGQPGRGKGGYTSWGINSPTSGASAKSTSFQRQGSPFNPTVLLRPTQPSNTHATFTQRQAIAHQYRNGIAIPPPPNLDQRQKVRPPPSKPLGQTTSAALGDASQQHASHRRIANALRGGRGRGGPIRGGVVNDSPGHSGHGGHSKGRGDRTAPV